MAYAVALDPGGTTGVCIVENDQLPFSLRVLHMTGEHHKLLYDYLEFLDPAVIICEAFENRGNVSAFLKPVEYVGIVKYYIQNSRCAGVWQSASTGKQFFHDDRLKQINLYAEGLRHARDATRHYLYWRCITEHDYSILRGTTSGLIRRLPNLPQRGG